MTKRMTKAQRAQDDVQRFTCRGCKRRVPWSFGCDDEMPHHCDDCWAAVHALDAKRPPHTHERRRRRG